MATLSSILSLFVVLMVFGTTNAEDEDQAMQTIEGYKTTYKTLKEGSGAEVVGKGDKVTVHATGIVQQTGKKFWSTRQGRKSILIQRRCWRSHHWLGSGMSRNDPR